jgi:hypothetical protein
MYLIYIQVWKHVGKKFRQIQVVVYFEHYFAGVPERLWYLHSAAHHFEMSQEPTATCVAHPSHSSTVVTCILTIERQTEYRHIVPSVCKVHIST